ncbi:protein YgfX [Pseudomonas sp. NPDC089554]|uniref:protein YgfX n=1 Tax=Pseudomonas sp. NPDC089554 TaxID=3390653 RepID=UPI003CFFA2F4
MSSPSDVFQCRWQGSRLLLTAYLVCLALALSALFLVALPTWLKLSLIVACLVHSCWAIPRQILLTHAHAVTGLRRDARGWQLFSQGRGWQPVRLCPDSVALPGLVVLRFEREGRWLGEGVCILLDGLSADEHRRLRVRLKFSRRRWANIPRST